MTKTKMITKKTKMMERKVRKINKRILMTMTMKRSKIRRRFSMEASIVVMVMLLNLKYKILPNY